MNQFSIEIINLSKKYDKLIAVNNISFKIKKGTLFSLLGQNGAGKSTTISMISGIVKPTSGEIYFENKKLSTNCDFIKNNLGIVFQDHNLDDGLSVFENIRLRASFYNISKQNFKTRYDFLAKKFNIKSYENRLVKNLSGGQKRKSDILRSLIHSPKILILDEPTTGLDPESRLQIWKVLNDLRKKENLTILLTTHYLEEADKSDYIVIVDKGKIVAEGASIELKNKYSNDVLKIYGQNLDIIRKKLNSQKISSKIENDALIVNSKKKGEIIEIISKNKELIKDFEVIKGTLDNVFMEIINHGKKYE